MKMKKSVVDHTYRDFSEVTLSDLGDSLEHWNADLFPAKLHKILSNPEYAHIIAWKSHGRAWAVLDRSLFLEVVLPNHFNHRNSGSFNRSVNGWGFKRLVAEGPDHNSYYHELFLRGKPELTSLMTRLINPGKRLPDKAGEPDFYAISEKHPLPDPLNPSGIHEHPVSADAREVSRVSTPSSAWNDRINQATSHAPSSPVSKRGSHSQFYSLHDGSNIPYSNEYHYHTQETTAYPPNSSLQHPNQMHSQPFISQHPPFPHQHPPTLSYLADRHPYAYAQYPPPPQYLQPSPVQHPGHICHAQYYPQPLLPSPSSPHVPPIFNAHYSPPSHHVGSFPPATHPDVAWHHNRWDAATQPGQWSPSTHHDSYRHRNVAIQSAGTQTHNPEMAMHGSMHDSYHRTVGEEDRYMHYCTNRAALDKNNVSRDMDSPALETHTDVVYFDKV